MCHCLLKGIDFLTNFSSCTGDNINPQNGETGRMYLLRSIYLLFCPVDVFSGSTEGSLVA